MTDKQSTLFTANRFYAALDHNYDKMTRDHSRWDSVKDQYEQLLETYKPKRILDVGCGTGGEAITLASMGYSLVGIDGSDRLIEIAHNKAKDREVEVEFNVDDMTVLESISDESVDMIICRGNTLPHLLTMENMKSCIKSFKRVCSPNGLLILQWLNYDLIKKTRKRQVGITGNETAIFHRFYDFISEDQITFNTVIMNYESSWKSEWISTTLRPWSADDVGMLLVQGGWSDLEIASNILRNDFDPNASGNVVLFAVNKPK